LLVRSLAVAAWLVAAPLAALEPGDYLDQSNWREAEGLLPAEFLAAYERGDFRHQVRDGAIDKIAEDPVFKAALDANRGRFELSDDGSIVDKATGQPPAYVYAWPFPDIDADDPKAATKIV